MNVVTGAKGKNLEMARLFIERKGDFFLDYGKNAHRHSVFDEAGVRDRVHEIGRNVPVATIVGVLESMVRTHSDFTMFIDGNFDEQEIELLREWASLFPTLSLTVSQQTQNEVLEVLTV